LANILELRREERRAGYYLDGVPVFPGSQIQLQVYCGKWISGLFEWEGHLESRPRLRAVIGINAPAQQTTFVIHPHSFVRWPIADSPSSLPGDQLSRAGDGFRALGRRLNESAVDFVSDVALNFFGGG
jgi:hypothetical protein